ncbi:hypothetical protein Tco_0461774, partial [Tanacetum coccineum]
MFDIAFRRVNTFVDYKTAENPKKAEAEVIEGSSKRAGDELEQENAKKQKIEDDAEKEELKACLEIVPHDSIKNKEIEQNKEPPRGIMWLKGRVNKDEQFPDDEIRSLGDKLKEIEDKIKEGTLKVDHGADAMTVVLGKEKGGYARGVGSGVTYKRYFDLPRSRQASDERIMLL